MPALVAVMDTEPALAVTAVLEIDVPAFMVTLVPALMASELEMAPAEPFVALMLTELEAPVAVTAPVLVMPALVAVMPMEPPVASTVEPLEMLVPALMVMPVAAWTAPVLVREVYAFWVRVVPALTVVSFWMASPVEVISTVVLPSTASLFQILPTASWSMAPAVAVTAPVLVRVVFAFWVMFVPAVTAPVFSMLPVPLVAVSIDTAPPALTISFLMSVPAVRLMPPLVLLTVRLLLLLSIAVLADMVILPVPAVTLASFWISAPVEVMSIVVPA